MIRLIKWYWHNYWFQFHYRQLEIRKGDMLEIYADLMVYHHTKLLDLEKDA